MRTECEYCGADDVVPVIDKRIERRPTAGNKYRQRCLACWRWHPCCAAEDWETHDDARILPADADPDNEENLLTPEEWEREKAEEEREQKQNERLKEVKERVGGGEVATDGAGDDQDHGDDVEDSDDEVEETNEFDCPECGEHVTGFPDECPACGVPYRWDN